MAGDGRSRQQPSSSRLDETVHYALSKEYRAPRIILAALALSILTSPGCRGQVNSPSGPDQPGTGFATTEALPAQTLDSTPASSVTLALLGDVMLGRAVHPTAETFTY